MPVYKDQKSGKWWARVNFTDPLGKPRNRKTPKIYETKAEAQIAEAQLRLSNNLDSSSAVTFNKIYEEFLEYQEPRIKKSTLITYKPMYDHAREVLGNVRIDKLNVAKYNAFKKYLDETVPSTDRKNKIHCFLKQLVRYADTFYNVKCDVLDKCGGFKDPDRVEKEEMDFFTYREFMQFIKYPKEPYKTLYCVLFFCGLRLGEANALQWKDIDFHKQQLHVYKTANTKMKGVPYMITSPKTKGSNRFVPIEERTLHKLEELKLTAMTFTNFSDEWFVFGGIRPLGESNVGRIKDKACDDAGLRRIRTHDFRHSCASFLIELGAPIQLVSKWLGHSKLSTTMNIYSHMYPSQVMNMLEKMNSFMDRELSWSDIDNAEEFGPNFGPNYQA